MDLPLASLRVLDLTEGDAQYCGRYLAAEAGRVILAGTADILLESFSQAQAEEYCLTPEALRQAHPGLVVVSVTGFGRSGPYRDFAATGPVLAALGGVLSRRQWRAMFAWLGEPAGFADPRYDAIPARFAAAGQLNPLIAALFADRAREDLVAEGAKRGIPVSGVLTPAEVLTARHFDEAGTLADADLGEASGSGPLAGLRVLDLGVIVFGAELGRLLADQGADVIKVENSAFPDGLRQTLTADVVLANFKPGTLASLGLSYAELSQVNPRIIVSDSSAFGSTGAWSDRLGYGPLVRASGGISELWRDPDGAFCDGVTVYPDHVAAHVAAIAVLAAVIGRARSGRGAALEVAQADVAVMHLGPVLAALGAGHADSPGSTAWVLPCAGDDEWCVIDVRDEEDLTRLAGLVEGADLARWTSERRPDEVMAAVQAAGVPAGSMRRLPELLADPHLAARQSFRTMSHPLLSRPVPANARAARFSTIGDPPQRAAPVPGEHTRQVAGTLLGLSPGEIDHLIREGILEETSPTVPDRPLTRGSVP
jgi:crotonobetainyl-CoA:carnitine CoA-transferase CaiB-like acyl-CoA transferase